PMFYFFFSSRRRHTRFSRDWSSDVCSSDLRAAKLIQRSDALLDIIAAVVRHYEARKRARSLLDFDDLVEKLANLFEHESGEWVQIGRASCRERVESSVGVAAA